MFEHAKRLNEPFSCVMCDLDRFKSVNDTHGHQAGDAVLKQFARILKHEAREKVDRVGRYGGEEFMLLLPGTVLTREWNGHNHRVMVVSEGYTWDGQTYDSLSKIAYAITGTKWNGPRFFGLRDKWPAEMKQ